MTGGVARNPAAVKHISETLGAPLIVPERPQIAGALGAALFALDDYRQQGASARAKDAKIEADIDSAAVAMRACAPACAVKAAKTPAAV